MNSRKKGFFFTILRFYRERFSGDNIIKMIGLLLIIFTFWAFSQWDVITNQDKTTDLTINLISEAIGIVITILFIEHAISRLEKKEEMKWEHGLDAKLECLTALFQEKGRIDEQRWREQNEHQAELEKLYHEYQDLLKHSLRKNRSLILQQKRNLRRHSGRRAD